MAVIDRQQRLLRAVRALLPSPLDAHCLYASIEGRTLTLVTDSPVWGSRLRFFAPELEPALAQTYGEIKACRVRIQPPSDQGLLRERKRPAHRLAAGTITHLLETADGMGDTELADALRRLARTGAGRDKTKALCKD